MDAAEYKHVVLGLIFLKYISDAFQELHDRLQSQVSEGADPEDPDEYRAENIFWVPRKARWPWIESHARTAHHWTGRGRRHDRHRAGQPGPQGRPAQGLRAARP